MLVRDAGGHCLWTAGGLLRSQALEFSEEISRKDIGSATPPKLNLVFAKFSESVGEKKESSILKQQVRQSVTMALKEAHQQKNQVIVISGSVVSSQGEEVMETTKFAELLRNVRLSDIARGDANHFNCIFIAVQSETQQAIFNDCFQK